MIDGSDFFEQIQDKISARGAELSDALFDSQHSLAEGSVLDLESAMTIIECMRSGQAGDAEIYKHFFSGKFVQDYNSGLFYKYGNGYWEVDKKDESLTECEVIGQIYQQAYQALVRKGSYDRSYLQGIAKKISSKETALNKLQYRKQVREMASQGEDGLGISGEQWDSEPYLICCKNAIVDLKTGYDIDADPELYLRRHTDINWDPPSGEPKTFLKCLEDIFAFTEPEPDRSSYTEYSDIEAEQDYEYRLDLERWKYYRENYTSEMVDFIQVLLGYALIGKVIEHYIFFFWGSGRNGKTLLMNILQHIFGDYAGAVEPELLMTNRNGKSSGAASPDILMLQGKRFVYGSETTNNARLDPSVVKRIVGGDELVARGLYANDYTKFKPSHTLVVLTNNKPSAPSDDFALWKRMVLVPFLVSFVDDPDPDDPSEKLKDPYLTEKILQESTQILNWIIDGAIRYQKEGLPIPESIAESTNEYRDEMDTISMFLDECCDEGPGYIARSQQLYNTYKKWAIFYGHKPYSITTFSPMIKKRLGGRFRDSRGFYFKGLAVDTFGHVFLDSD